MPGAHREFDPRFCAAVTTPVSQGSVFVNGRKWAVQGDPNSHGEGRLIPVVGSTVFIEGKLVIVAAGDIASPDLALHPAPPTDPSVGSPNVKAYG